MAKKTAVAHDFNVLVPKESADKILSVLELDLSGKKLSASFVEKALAKLAKSQYKPVCIQVSPEHMDLAAELCRGSNIKINVLARTDTQLEFAIEQGADELTIIFPHKEWLAGNLGYPKQYFTQMRNIAIGHGDFCIALESEVLEKAIYLTEAATEAAMFGADWLQLSSSDGITPEHANAVLEVVGAHNSRKKEAKRIGFKAGKGVDTILQAADYLILGQAVLGADKVVPECFRIAGSMDLFEECAHKAAEQDK
ncbi:MAG: hypothetical protein FWF01_01300 [Alphaproteobacteria bacterium]|nr:hypothetical protein [Alphaproteobacteria bacterium]